MSGSTRVASCLRFGLLGAVLSAGCGDSSGPSDTTIALNFGNVPAATNQASLSITGTTDPGAQVTVSAPADTVVGDATATGSFSLAVDLVLNALNSIEVGARDNAGNTIVDTLEVLHDNVSPNLNFTSPGTLAPTAGQSGFSISVAFADGSAGIDPASFSISADRELGGVFNSDGTSTTILPAGTELAGLFGSVSASDASLTVPDSLIFPAGEVMLTAEISDAAGNDNNRSVTFSVGADPTQLIVVNSQTAAGSTGHPIVVGLANGEPVGGIQFDIIFDTNLIASVDSVAVHDRADGFDSPPFNQIAPGQVRVLVFDSGGADIPGGQGPILTVWVEIDAAASAGAHAFTLENIVISDDFGGSEPVATATGEITIS